MTNEENTYHDGSIYFTTGAKNKWESEVYKIIVIREENEKKLNNRIENKSQSTQLFK